MMARLGPKIVDVDIEPYADRTWDLLITLAHPNGEPRFVVRTRMPCEQRGLRRLEAAACNRSDIELCDTRCDEYMPTIMPLLPVTLFQGAWTFGKPKVLNDCCPDEPKIFVYVHHTHDVEIMIMKVGRRVRDLNLLEEYPGFPSIIQ